MSNSYFYQQEAISTEHRSILERLEESAQRNSTQIYALREPLGENKYKYSAEKSFVVLVPKHKMMFFNLGENADTFEDYFEDFIEDVGSISDKYEYKSIIGRPRSWKKEMVAVLSQEDLQGDIDEVIGENKLQTAQLQKQSELLVSLVTGSINDIDRVQEEVPQNILEKVKQKIQIFDGLQTRFVYQDIDASKVTIQGLSGTGKTELLLHKLKETYLKYPDARILFTCHNKILAASMRKRIPQFFNFMKVEQQIEWDERFWCVHAWGSGWDPASGAYRYICEYYDLPFQRFSYSNTFKTVCKNAIDAIKGLDLDFEGYAFDFVFIDESQDFPSEFLELCEMVTKETVYIAGDIFQRIFDEDIVGEVQPDFLLNKCYRTDPRTLMFAHAVGMGLFESKKLRWLSDEEWTACGYLIDKNEQNNTYALRREPVKRFDDSIEEEFESVEIIRTSKDEGGNSNVHDCIIEIVRQIVEENPTVAPDDIGIVFTGNNKAGYELGDLLENVIPEEFGWEVSKAYEEKSREKDKLFYSNKNNVKGLEFPFVICVSTYFSGAMTERNALYMLLSRSFIKSFLLVADDVHPNRTKNIERGWEKINRDKCILTRVPTDEELKEIKQNLRTAISVEKLKTSTSDTLQKIFKELGVGHDAQEAIYKIISAGDKKKLSERNIRNFVESYLENLAGE